MEKDSRTEDFNKIKEIAKKTGDTDLLNDVQKREKNKTIFKDE